MRLSRFSTHRTILAVGIAVCIAGAVLVAFLLGLLDWLGLMF